MRKKIRLHFEYFRNRLIDEVIADQQMTAAEKVEQIDRINNLDYEGMTLCLIEATSRGKTMQKVVEHGIEMPF